MDLIDVVFSTDGFVPRKVCGHWTLPLMLLHNISDLLIWGAYFAIPIILAWFVRKRQDLPFPHIFWLFGAFIVSCGTTHLIEVVLFHTPVYVFSGLVKAFTALVSVATAVALIPICRKAVKFRGPSEVEKELTRRTNELVKSERMFQALANSMPQIVWISDPQGSVFYLNQRWYDYTGMKTGIDLSTCWLGYCHPDDQRMTAERWAECVATGRPYEIEYRLRAEGGDYRWQLGRAEPVRNEKGEIVRWYGTCTDIHDKKLQEEALREADRKKDEFLAVLGHELRNPLAPIATAVMLLKQRGPDDPQLNYARDVIGRQANQMGRLLDDLLDVARISNGQLVLTNEPLDYRTVIERAVETTATLIEAEEHTLEVEVPDRPVRGFGDFRRLVQVVVNLINNAVKYTDRKGRISIRMTVNGWVAQIVVEDNGTGIDPGLLSRVFDSFTQAPQGISRSRGGLGIGLTLVKRLVELHGGKVVVFSEGVGRGTRVTVTLPVTDVEPKKHDDTGNHAVFHKRKVLVVDDNRDNADMMVLCLTSAGHEAQAVYDGRAAVGAFSQFQPDAMLLDIGLPEMDGFEVAQEVRKTGKPCLIIAVTGYGQDQDRRRGIKAGFDHHLLKPVNYKKVLHVLSEF